MLLVAAFGITSHFASSDKIAKGVLVSGNDLGGLTRNQAEAKLQSWAVRQSRRGITLTAMDRRWSSQLASIGISVDWHCAADQAFAVGRTGNFINRLACTLTSTGCGKKIDAKLRVDRIKMQRTLRKIAGVVNRPHADARIHLVDSALEIKQDSCGIKLDEKRAADIICSSVQSGHNVIRLPVVTDRPDVTARDAVGIDTLLSSYTTTFNRGLKGRTHNLTLAARCVDGVILKAGQEFSCNAIIGPRLEQRGFRTAQIYIRGKLEDGIGGGVCQVSSTLFNSVLLAGLTISERSPHSQTVPYVRPGRDATVAYGHRDFKFVNSNDHPVAVVITINGSRLTAQIYGTSSDRKQVKLYIGKLSIIPAKSKTVLDTSLPTGSRKLVEKGATGYSVVLYREITQSDGSVAQDTFRSRYAPQSSVHAIGAQTQSSPVDGEPQ